MVRIQGRRLKRHRLSNILHSVLILGCMSFFAWLLASWFFGTLVAYTVALAVVVSLLFAPAITPDLLLRAYNAGYVHPAQSPALYRLIGSLAARAELPSVPKLYVVPSAVLNAFAIGSKENAALVVSQALLQRLTDRELIGVLAHEVAHIQNGDVKVMMLADSISKMVFLLTHIGQLLLLINLPLMLLGWVHIDWLVIFMLLFFPALLSLLQLGLSRTREYLADATAVALTGDPEGLASALRTISDQQGTWIERIFTPGRGESQPSLFRTHPPTDERIRRLLEMFGSDNSPVARLTERPFPKDHRPPHSSAKPRRYWHGYWY